MNTVAKLSFILILTTTLLVLLACTFETSNVDTTPNRALYLYANELEDSLEDTIQLETSETFSLIGRVANIDPVDYLLIVTTNDAGDTLTQDTIQKNVLSEVTAELFARSFEDANTYTVSLLLMSLNGDALVFNDVVVLIVDTFTPQLEATYTTTGTPQKDSIYSLSVALLAGATPVSYQWFKNAIALSDDTTDKLTFASLAYGDTASYQLVATNIYGSDTSMLITVSLPVNGAPLISGLQDQTINEGGSFSTLSLDDFVVDNEQADDELIWSVQNSGDMSSTYNETTRTLTVGYPTTLGWNGTDGVTVIVNDGENNDTAHILFTVTSVNDAPVITGLTTQTINEGSSFSTYNLNNYVTDIDHDDSLLDWSVSNTGVLSFSISPSKILSVGMPTDSNWTGTDTAQLIVSDKSLRDTLHVVFTVVNINDAPTIRSIPNQTIARGSTFSAYALISYVDDPDNTLSSLTWTATSSRFTSSIANNSNLSVTYSDTLFGTQDSLVDTILVIVNDGALKDSTTVIYTVVDEDTSGLLLHLPLNGDLNDLGPYGFMVSNNGVTSSTDGPNGNMSYDFTGANYLEIPYDSKLASPESFTLAVWAKSDTNYYQDGFIIDMGSGSDHHYGISFHEASEMCGRYNLNSVGATGIDITQWHHYAYTYDGVTSKFYVDGVLKNTRAIAQDYIEAYPFRVGMQSKSFSSTRHWEGNIAEVRLYNKALTISMISAIMQ